MPVSSDYIKTFSYSIRESQSSGKFDKMMQQFADTVAPYACSTARRRSLNGLSEEPEPDRRKGGGGGGTAAVAASASGGTTDATKSLGLHWTSMIGVFCISVFLQLVALLLWAIERCVGMSFSEMCGCGYKSDNEPDTEYEDDCPVPPFEHPQYEFHALPAQTPRIATALDLVGRTGEWGGGVSEPYPAQRHADRPPKRSVHVDGQERSLTPLPPELAKMMPNLKASVMERGNVSGVGFGQGVEQEGFREYADARATAAGDFVMGANLGNRPELESPDQPNGMLNGIQEALRCARVRGRAQLLCVLYARTHML